MKQLILAVALCAILSAANVADDQIYGKRRLNASKAIAQAFAARSKVFAQMQRNRRRKTAPKTAKLIASQCLLCRVCVLMAPGREPVGESVRESV
jgi:hypothetical protein